LLQTEKRLDEESLSRVIHNCRNPLLNDILVQSLITGTALPVHKQIVPLIGPVGQDTHPAEVEFQRDLQEFINWNTIDVLNPVYFTRGIER
jgi:hypothetical protein